MGIIILSGKLFFKNIIQNQNIYETHTSRDFVY